MSRGRGRPPKGSTTMNAAERQRRRKAHLQKCEKALLAIVAAYQESEREIEEDAGDGPGDTYDLLWQSIYSAVEMLEDRPLTASCEVVIRRLSRIEREMQAYEVDGEVDLMAEAINRMRIIVRQYAP